MKSVNYIFWLHLTLVALSYASQNGNMSIAGPYIATVTRSERCKVPTRPYEKNPHSLYHSEIYTSGKRTLLSGNLTVIRVNPEMRLSVKGFFLEKGRPRLMYLVNGLGCNSVLMRMFKVSLNVQQFDGCLPKGTYIYKDVDFNAVQHTWAKTAEYGSFMWRIFIGSRTTTTICWEYDNVNTPI